MRLTAVIMFGGAMWEFSQHTPLGDVCGWILLVVTVLCYLSGARVAHYNRGPR